MALISRSFLLTLLPTMKMRSVTSHSLDRELGRQFRTISPGITLDVGSRNGPYSALIPYTEYLRLDLDATSEPDIVGDAHDIPADSARFDNVIATEVLEHLESPQTAVNEFYRVLKPGGICILSTRFVFPYHPDPNDYYRFTEDSLRMLFSEWTEVEIIPHGNRLQAAWQLINAGKPQVLLNLFNPCVALLRFGDRRVVLGYVVRAQR